MFYFNRLFKKRKIIAFTHIPKAAGTTFHNLLRPNFFLRYCEVKNLSGRSSWAFDAQSMKKVFLINPFVTCIGGHTVLPFGNLVEVFPNIKFITLLRDPVERYISHFLHTYRKKRGIKTLDQFLNTGWSFNMQTRMIAGSDNLKKAKETLINRFLLVGIVEEFDEFLVLLRKKLKPMKLRINYKTRNVSDKRSIVRKDLYQNLDKYIHAIKDRNCLDLELYSFVRNELLSKEKNAYGTSYNSDLEEFKALKRRYSLYLTIPRYLDYVLRKCYYAPMFYFITKLDHMTFQ